MSRPRTIKRNRLPEWEQNLFQFLKGVRNSDLKWGTFDCVIGLASGAVKAQTGIDLAKGYRSKYRSEGAALKLIIKKGWTNKNSSLEQALADLMDNFLQRAPLGNRHRGNIVLLESEEGPGFGVRTGLEVVALSRDGGTRLFKPPVGAIEWTVT